MPTPFPTSSDHPRNLLSPYNAPGLFITATGSDIGKTVVTASLAAAFHQMHLRVGICKPFATGSSPLPSAAHLPSRDNDHYDCPDAAYAARAAGLDPTDTSLFRYMSPLRYAAPVSPALAAKIENRRPDWHRVAAAFDYWQEEAEVLLVEGAGGWYVPVDQPPRDFMIADLAAALRLPVLVVTNSQLGAINQTLLTIHAIQQKNLPVVGLVINRVPPPEKRDAATISNLEELPRLTGIPVRAILPDHPGVGPDLPLPAEFTSALLPFAHDWWTRTRPAN